MSRFIVTNQSGEEIASSRGIEDAMLLMRVLPAGAYVIRGSDGVQLARKLHGPMRDERPARNVPQMYAGIGAWGQA